MRIFKELPIVASLSLIVLAVLVQSVDAVVPGVTNVMSASSSGVYGNNTSYNPSLSGDGHYVVFESSATNLVPNDTNGKKDVFLRDTTTNVIQRISISSSGAEGNSDSVRPRISYGGRYVTYQSSASNLVGNDTNAQTDIFLYDNQLGTTALISQTSSGVLGNSASSWPDISADGRYITFASGAFNLDPSISTVSSQQPIGQQIFVKDVVTGSVKFISSRSGVRINDMSSTPRISCDGGLITFTSRATNLVANDTNGFTDIFIANRVDGANDIVNVTSNGNGESFTPAISCDGNHISYTSGATNLVSNDLTTSRDIFSYNRLSQNHTVVSISSDGTQAASGTTNELSSISGDGRYIVFQSNALNLVPNYSKGNNMDIYIRDARAGTTQIMHVKADGTIANKRSDTASISPDGSYVVYLSSSDDLIPNIVNPYFLPEVYISKTGF